jgi:septal ring factor EnvC (AmiA/AmiB activator)
LKPGMGINEKATHEPVSPLTKHQLELKVKNLTKYNEELKQEVEEYKVLDRHIKKENAQLKENNCRLQGEHDEVSSNLNKVLCLVQYTPVIKRELKYEASGLDILKPGS